MKTAGTKEWAAVNLNICQGCEHNCKYCYAKKIAMHYGRKTEANWKEMVVDQSKVDAVYHYIDGMIMFPSSHDITPSILDAYMTVLHKLIYEGNEVLIVSKPHIECITRICNEMKEFKDQIMFRFTIGSDINAILQFWEPGAPSFEERVACLQLAYTAGYKTSVSMEPILSAPIPVIRKVLPFITEELWLGPLNNVAEKHYIDETTATAAFEFTKGPKLFELYHEAMLEFGEIIKFKDTFMKKIEPWLKQKTLPMLYKKCRCCGEYYHVSEAQILDPRSFCNKRECSQEFDKVVSTFKKYRKVAELNFHLFRKEGEKYARVCPVCGNSNVPGTYFCPNHSDLDIMKRYSWPSIRTTIVSENMAKNGGLYRCEFCKELVTQCEVHHIQAIFGLNAENYRLIWEPSNCKVSCVKCHKIADENEPTLQKSEKFQKKKYVEKMLTEFLGGNF